MGSPPLPWGGAGSGAGYRLDPAACAVGFGGFWPRGSFPVLGMLGCISRFVMWGWGGVAGDSVTRLSGTLSTRHSYGLFYFLCDLCVPLYTHMLLLLSKL